MKLCFTVNNSVHFVFYGKNIKAPYISHASEGSRNSKVHYTVKLIVTQDV